MAPVPRVTGPPMPISRPAPAAGPAPGWMAMTSCVSRYSPDLARAGLPSRWRDAWPWNPVALSSPTSLSTASSMPRSAGPRTTVGAITCPGPSPSAAGGDAREAAPPPSLPIAVPSRNGPWGLPTGREPGHWEADLMLFGNQGQALLVMTERPIQAAGHRPPARESSPTRGPGHGQDSRAFPSPLAPLRRL